MKVSVVVPVYNEEENVNLLHEKLKEALDGSGHPHELIFVDDGSTDRSYELLRNIQAADPNTVVIRFRKNFGQTAAFTAGFDHATGDVVVTIDGDLQNEPGDIPKLVSLIGDNDIVSGWRKDRKDPFLNRRLPSQIANWLISKVTGVHLHDYGCSLKAYKREVLENTRLYGEMHRFIPAVASSYGVRIAEVETRHYPRMFGKSKYGISRTFKVLLDLIMIKFFQSFYTRPLRAFGPAGLFSFAVGFLTALKLSFEKLYYHRDIGGRPLLILSVLLIIVGVQLIVMGLLGEFMVRIYFETQGKPVYHIRDIHDSRQRS